MKKTSIPKIAALCSFIILMTCFLLYRADLLDLSFTNDAVYLQTSPNGGAIPGAKAKDTVHRAMLSSSKSMVVYKPNGNRRYDSLKKNNDTTAFNRYRIIHRNRELIGSSKSGYIFKPPIQNSAKKKLTP